MQKRRLGRTGLWVSEIGLGGAWLLGRRGDAALEAGVATVHRALAIGVDYLDTAECYIGGRSEAVVGTALAGHPASPVVATKCGHRPAGFDFSRQAVVASARESLRILRRPTVDVFQLHTPPELPLARIMGPGGALEGLREVQEQGWCRFLGITGRDVDFLRRCIETDGFDTVLIFWRYDLVDQSASELFAEARAHDMGIKSNFPWRSRERGAKGVEKR